MGSEKIKIVYPERARNKKKKRRKSELIGQIRKQIESW